MLETTAKLACMLLRWPIAASFALQVAPAQATDYRIDPKETTSTFEVRLFGLIPMRGVFKQTSGMLQLNPQGQASDIEVVIDATNVEVHSEQVQATARGPDFFDVERFPTIHFKSSRFTFEGDRLQLIDGVLTLRGARHPVTLVVAQSNCRRPVANEVGACRAQATVSVKRSDFGMRSWNHIMGDEVIIRIAIAAFSQPNNTTGQSAAAAADAVPRKAVETIPPAKDTSVVDDVAAASGVTKQR